MNCDPNYHLVYTGSISMTTWKRIFGVRVGGVISNALQSHFNQLFTHLQRNYFAPFAVPIQNFF